MSLQSASLRTFVSLAGLLVSLLLVSAAITLIAPHPSHAQTISDIQAQIDENNKHVQDLEAEIATYQKQLDQVNGQKQTLQSAIKSIDISRQKLLAQISVTQTRITAANLKLNELGLKITDKSKAIDLDQKAVGQTIRSLDQQEGDTMIERLLSTNTLADGWTSADQLSIVNGALHQNADGLASDRIVLNDQHAAVAATKADLDKLHRELATQEGELDANKAAKQKLLTQTNQTASTYTSLIAQKRAQQKVFESALSALEDSLKNINPATVPSTASGILTWPFSATFAQSCLGKAGALGNPHCITQYFGTTPFSTANPQVYNGNGHNAIDIGMPQGTSVLAALTGTVWGTGNTDAIPGCYSYGKWVLIKHANGLSTLYAHLSSINVSAGQSVSTGTAIGYSGMTGYATGPHLHFGVYATSGTSIMTLQQFRGATTPCANASMPVAPKDAYLNPLSYLPG